MSDRAPWLAHYDRGVPATLAPYPDRTLLDYVSDYARLRPQAPALLFKGLDAQLRRARRAKRRLRRGARRRSACRRGDRVALLLPNCPQFVDRRVRRMEDRRHRRAAESDLHGTRARSAAARARDRDDRHADAVLRARQTHAAADRRSAGDRHQHQRVFPAAAAVAVHVAP